MKREKVPTATRCPRSVSALPGLAGAKPQGQKRQIGEPLRGHRSPLEDTEIDEEAEALRRALSLSLRARCAAARTPPLKKRFRLVPPSAEVEAGKLPCARRWISPQCQRCRSDIFGFKDSARKVCATGHSSRPRRLNCTPHWRPPRPQTSPILSDASLSWTQS